MWGYLSINYITNHTINHIAKTSALEVNFGQFNFCKINYSDKEVIYLHICILLLTVTGIITAHIGTYSLKMSVSLFLKTVIHVKILLKDNGSLTAPVILLKHTQSYWCAKLIIRLGALYAALIMMN